MKVLYIFLLLQFLNCQTKNDSSKEVLKEEVKKQIESNISLKVIDTSEIRQNSNTINSSYTLKIENEGGSSEIIDTFNYLRTQLFINLPKELNNEFDFHKDENFELTKKLKRMDKDTYSCFIDKYGIYKAIMDFDHSVYYYSFLPNDTNFFILVSTMEYDGKKLTMDLFKFNNQKITKETELASFGSYSECTLYSKSKLLVNKLRIKRISDCADLTSNGSKNIVRIDTVTHYLR